MDITGYLCYFRIQQHITFAGTSARRHTKTAGLLHQRCKVVWGNAQLQCSCICSNLLRDRILMKNVANNSACNYQKRSDRFSLYFQHRPACHPSLQDQHRLALHPHRLPAQSLLIRRPVPSPNHYHRHYHQQQRRRRRHQQQQLF